MQFGLVVIFQNDDENVLNVVSGTYMDMLCRIHIGVNIQGSLSKPVASNVCVFLRVYSIHVAIRHCTQQAGGSLI